MLTSIDQSRPQHFSLWRRALDCFADIMQAEVEGHIHKLLTDSCQMTNHLVAGWV